MSLKCPIDVRQLKTVISNKTKYIERGAFSCFTNDRRGYLHMSILLFKRQMNIIQDNLMYEMKYWKKAHDVDGLGRWGSVEMENKNLGIALNNQSTLTEKVVL